MQTQRSVALASVILPTQMLAQDLSPAGQAFTHSSEVLNCEVQVESAAETGARTAVLDPIEGGGAIGSPQDYLGLMRANVATLAAGQECLA